MEKRFEGTIEYRPRPTNSTAITSGAKDEQMINTVLKRTNAYAIALAWRIAVVFAMLILAAVSGKERDREQVDAPGAINYSRALEDRTNMDFEGTLELLRKAANAGNLEAQELLPVLLLGGPSSLQMGGEGGLKTCEALLWFDRAAAQGSRLGETFKGMMGASELAFARKHCMPNVD